MELILSSSIFPISPSQIVDGGYELEDSNIIPNYELAGGFIPEKNKVELHIYDTNKNLINSNYEYNKWRVINNSNTQDRVSKGQTVTNEIVLDPIQDIKDLGYIKDKSYLVYNFINYELNSSPKNQYFISEISPDRTEIRLSSNYLSNDIIKKSYNLLKRKLNNPKYFDEFYISFRGNIQLICLNLDLDTNSSKHSILVKLYSPLPQSYSVKSECYIITKIGESKAFETDFFLDTSVFNENITYLRGPNTNLELKDFINNSTTFKNKEELLRTNSSSSQNNLNNVLNQRGIKITPNYSYETFNEFIHFSSAKSRINNFIDKLSNIQSYEDDIDTLQLITGSTSESFQVSSSLNRLNNNIEEIIKNFDGYEYYLYYNTSSLSYPKSGSSFPMSLLPVDSPTALNWLGSDQENSQYYGGIILSASRYDENNQDWLFYTIPDFIKENPDNDNYLEFCNMVGQHFDTIWLYTKHITEKNNTTNELDKGIPLKLAEKAISSLGYKGHGNNYNNQDNYIGLTGEDDRSYVPPTGSELITEYIAINGGEVVNYWALNYSYANYVEQLFSPGFPYAIDDVSKEIFKRLYHNMSYLIKKKGTISGLRQLINIWGIPNTILRINEFGGKNKNNVNDYDLYYNRYNYAYSPISTQHQASSSLRIPWMPLTRNYINDSEFIVPDTIQFRFKTTGYPSSSYSGEYFSQSLLVKKSNNSSDTSFDFGIGLSYTGSAQTTYSGSQNDTYKDWGIINFYLSGSAADGGIISSSNIYLPLFNKEWWSVQISRNQHVSASDDSQLTTYSIFVKNKPQDFSTNEIKFQGSASITTDSSSFNRAWNSFGTSSLDGIYLGGYISGSQVGTATLSPAGKILSGSLQEFRYYSNPIDEFVFNDYVMDPESIEGLNSSSLLSSFDILNFRAPLGNELESLFTTTLSSSYSSSLSSYHPASQIDATGLITSSFINPMGLVTSSNYEVIYYENTTLRTYSKPNVETYFLDQPSIGLRNRVNNKIQIDNNTNYGDILSSQKSIFQNYPISKSYTEPNNYLEVAFSPQNEVNDDIIHTFGFNNISNLLGDPNNFYNSSSNYPLLKDIAIDYFKKYSKGNIYDYLRLIKYFDNSLFKAIKNYVPARTNLSTGIVIKQHLLERNKYTPSKPNFNTEIAKSPTPGFNTSLIYKNLELEASLSLDTISGSTGGSFNKFNYLDTPDFHQLPITQSWENIVPSVVGNHIITEDKQKEFYDGELSGSRISLQTQDVFVNPYKTPILIESLYNITVLNLPIEDFLKNPSGSFNITIDSTIGNNNSQNEYIEISNYTLSASVVATIFLNSPSPTSTYQYVKGIVISSKDYTGVPHYNGWPEIASEAFGYYPTSSYIYGDTLKDEFPRPPYFLINLPSPTTGSILSGGDPNSGNLSWKTINSAGLNVKGTGINSQGDRWFVFENQSPTYNRPISGSSGFGWGNSYTFSGSFGDFQYISALKALNRYNILNPVFDFTVPNIGSAILEFLPKTFYKTSSFDEYSLTNIIFNHIDANNNYNKNTLLANPLFTTYLTSSSPLYTDSYNLPSNLIDKSYLNLYNYINYNNASGTGLNATLFQFIPNGRTNPLLTSTSSIFYFNPDLLETINFDNSDYNALLNNYNDNRQSNKYMKVDYTFDIYNPINLSLIRENKAELAQTPDSNYSLYKNTLSKYLGTKLKSLDYNNYSPAGVVSPSQNLFSSQSNSYFLNGDTGSWEGDTSYGKVAVIDKNPIYMAHFTSYQSTPSYWGVKQYILDQLIYIPNKDITQQQGYEPKSIQLKGYEKNIYEISSNFESQRQTEIYYGDNNLILPLSNGENIIQNSGMYYKTIYSNQINETSESLNWYYNVYNTEYITGSNSLGSTVLTTGSNYLQLSGSIIPPIYFRKTSNSSPAFLITGSIGLGGPYLGTLHTYNQLLANGIYYDSSSHTTASFGQTGSLGVSPSLKSNLVSNYYLWNSVSSSLKGYESEDEPFLIKRGDEIRVTYTVGGGTASPSQTLTQIFTVTNVQGREVPPSGNKYLYINSDITLATGSALITPIFDRIEVIPNPATLTKLIPNGNISSFTIRRLTPSDNKLLITIPDGDLDLINASTTSSINLGLRSENPSTNQGFLLPSDLSRVQKQNALNIINQLKSKNVFKS